MMKFTSLGICKHLGAFLAVMLIGSIGYAQPVDSKLLAKNPEAAGVKFDLDTFTLLTSDQIFPTELKGPVWSVNPNSSFGKRLIQIPILLEPGEKPVVINSSLLKISRATFICYRLDDFGEAADLVDRARADQRQFDAGSAAQAAKDPRLVNAIPVMAKKFTLLPNGKVQYQASTVNVRYCTVVPYADGDSLYKLKLDIRAYQKMRPTPPERPRDRSYEAQQTFGAANRQYRQLFSEYLQLGREARALPKDLEINNPTRIWAVFEIDNSMPELSFSGMKPLPWNLKMENLELLRGISTKQVTPEVGADGVSRLDAEHANVILTLAKLINKRHPYDLQLAALTVSLTHMVGYAHLGDTQFFLLKAILEAKDSMARKFIMAELRQTLPPTRATIELAKLVVVQGVGTVREKTAAVTEMLKAVKADPNQATSSAETINTMLANEEGPAPSTLLKSLFDVARDNPQVRNTFIQSIRFQSLPENRLNDALVYIVENAGAEPLAAGWLNEHFLGSANVNLLKKTLTVIAEADTGARDLGPMFNWAVNKLFGKPAEDNGQKLRKARMRRPIPIMTPDDSIYRALRHGDPKIRELAWRSLPRFVIPIIEQPQDPNNPNSAVARKPENIGRYQELLGIALDMLTTPPGVVTFLERQPDKLQVAQSLVQIVLRGSTHAQMASIRALIGSKAPLGNILLDLSPGERQGFAMLVYEIGAKMIPPPMVVDVLRRREANNPVARWFGDEVAKGDIPSTSAWVDQFDGEGQLLELVASNDQALARGAAAVMVTAIGGTDRDALEFREKVRTLPDQTAESIAKAWTQTKLKLFSAQLKRYEGHYRMILMIAEGDSFGGQTDVPMREIPVGVVQLRINEKDKTASLSNDQLEVSIGDEYHSIRIDKPAQLKSFPNEDLKSVALEKVTTPVLLKLQDDGTWKGSFTLEGGIQAQLRMIPVQTGTPAATGTGV